eukprot:scaffold117737_cov25-Cyclotella_meneghiniana.AAC.2
MLLLLLLDSQYVTYAIHLTMKSIGNYVVVVIAISRYSWVSNVLYDDVVRGRYRLTRANSTQRRWSLRGGARLKEAAKWSAATGDDDLHGI